MKKHKKELRNYFSEFFFFNFLKIKSLDKSRLNNNYFIQIKFTVKNFLLENELFSHYHSYYLYIENMYSSHILSELSLYDQ